jgi:hypothetical protein
MEAGMYACRYVYDTISVCMYVCMSIQGGAMNRGLLFAGPPPPPLGGCERKD